MASDHATPSPLTPENKQHPQNPQRADQSLRAQHYALPLSEACLASLPNKLHHRPRAEWALASTPNVDPNETEFSVDSGVSMQLMSKTEWSPEELNKVLSITKPHNGDYCELVNRHNREAIIYVKVFDMFVLVQLFEDTRAVLSLGKLCEENAYSCEWKGGETPNLVNNGKDRTLQMR